MWFPSAGEGRAIKEISSLPVKNATAGPKGCVALDIVYPGTGWPTGNVNIKAKVTYNSNEEDTWVDYVYRSAECSDGIDNDNDGLIDYYAPWGYEYDTECSYWEDDSESS